MIPILEIAAGSSGRPLLAEGSFILTRSHTRDAPSSHIMDGGNAWDTVKPLTQWFKDLHRVILVDDDAFKVYKFSAVWPLSFSCTCLEVTMHKCLLGHTFGSSLTLTWLKSSWEKYPRVINSMLVATAGISRRGE